jgi:hypothetical protein
LGAGQPVVPHRTRRGSAVKQPMSLGPGRATTQPHSWGLPRGYRLGAAPIISIRR